MGWFGEKAKRERKRMERYMHYATAKGIEETEAMKSRAEAGFEANLSVLGMFGQPGTYGPGATAGGATPGTPGAPGGGGPLGIHDVTSERSEVSEEAKQFGSLAETTRKGVLDPTAFSQYVAGTKPFQIISGQVAEAHGLTDPQSPFRQTLEQSIKNPILEAGAETMRESMRQIKNAAAKGGSARRTALREAQQMLAVERSNRVVSQQLWQANLQFEGWIRDYQRNAVNAAQAFTEGLGVQRYVETMNRASEFMVQTTLPTAAKYQQAAYEAAAKNKKDGLGKMILGAALVVGGSLLGGAGLVGALAAGVTTIGTSLAGGGEGGGGGTTFNFAPSGPGASTVPGTPGYGGGGAMPLTGGGYASTGGFLPS